MNKEIKDGLKGLAIIGGLVWFGSSISGSAPPPTVIGQVTPCFSNSGAGLKAVEEYIRENRGPWSYTVTVSTYQEQGQDRFTVISNVDQTKWKPVKYMGYYDTKTCQPTLDWIGGV